MYYFYIIFSQSLDKYYIGHTSNLAERIRRHNTNHEGYTGKANDWKLVYSEIFESKSEAYARELQIKKWKNKRRILMLIKRGSDPPD